MSLTFLTINSGSLHSYERAACPDEAIRVIVKGVQENNGRLPNGWTVTLHGVTEAMAWFGLRVHDLTITHCWLCLTETGIPLIHHRIAAARLPLVQTFSTPKTLPWLAVGMAIESIQLFGVAPHRFMEAPAIEVATAWALIEKSINKIHENTH
jgi:hypothetical protein